MAQIGAGSWSFKTDLGWRGMTTTSKALPQHFDLLEDCYVSGDGSEIRSFPGYVCLIDPVTDARLATDTSPSGGPQGFESIHIDARRSVTATASTTYLVNQNVGSITDTMLIWNRPTTLHCVEQVHGRWIFVGEGSDRIEPIYSSGRTAFVYVISYDDNGTDIDLTLNSAPDTTSSNFNAISAGWRIYVEGLTGALASILNGKTHAVTSVVGAVVTIDTNPGGAISSVTGQTGIIGRTSRNGLSGAASSDSDNLSDDKESLMSWTATQRGGVNISPIERVYPSHVANRQRDFGDTAAQVNEGLTNYSAGVDPRSRRRQKNIPYRIVPHVAGNKIIAAAPGYGCVFQVPATIPVDFAESSSTEGLPWSSNDIYDRPRCLGVPKAVCFEDPDKTEVSSLHIQDVSGKTAPEDFAFGGTSYGSRTGTYKFKFAYKDEVTGEVGLCSEPIEVSTAAAAATASGFVFYIYFPGYLMHESLALSINVYRTTKDGDSYYFDRTVPLLAFISGVTTSVESAKYGLQPSSDLDAYYHHVRYEAVYQSDDLLKKQDGYVPEALEQMPMGCKTARTIRGWTLFGGALGNAGPFKEIQLGTATLEYDNSSGVSSDHYNYNELTCRFTDAATDAPYVGMETGFGCSANSIPPAYAGQIMFSRSLFPYPRHTVRLNKLINTITGGTPARFPDVRYSIVDTPVRSTEPLASAEFRNQEAYLVLPRGRIHISEPDNPGVVPATNTTIIANEKDEDIEGIGDAGGSAVVCTRSKTYFLGFSSSPVGVPAEVANDQFGCIAPNSMVEFAGGCAWISDRGPVAMVGGAVQWIGEPLERLFYPEGGRYLRDRDGMMRHSWACHDAERGLLYFGMFADRAAGTSNEVTVSYRGASYSWTDTNNESEANQIRSRFPCDEILVYSYRVGSWSVWRPPTCIAIQWMTRGMDKDGNNRVAFLGNDKRLYVLDDAYGQFDRETNYTTVLETGSVTTIGTTTSIATGIKMRPGMLVALYTGGGATALTLIGTRTISSTTASTIVLDSAITIPTGGCKMVVGARKSTIRTTFHNWKGGERASLGKIGIRYSLWSRYTAEEGDPGTTVQAAFMSATASTSERRNGIPTVKTALSFSTDGSYTYTPLSETGATEHVFDRETMLGEVGGVNHQVELQVVGGAQVRIYDIYGEVK